MEGGVSCRIRGEIQNWVSGRWIGVVKLVPNENIQRKRGGRVGHGIAGAGAGGCCAGSMQVLVVVFE